jgi:hypothetical protein
LVIGIEVGPVHGDNNIRARPDRMGNPSFREFVDVNSRVREQCAFQAIVITNSRLS